MTMSAAQADEVLAETLNAPATPHLLLHTGDPGAAGTANVAQIDTDPIVRKAISFDAPGNHPDNIERRVMSDSAVAWAGESDPTPEIDAAQEITHFSIWSADTAGQVEHIAALTPPKITGSDGVTVASGAVEAAIQVFAKPA